jgi:DNA invertase Pin-like site-specific DNA recombinase
MKVVLYARVSKDESVNDNRYQNPENQLKALREYCKLNDYEVVKEYVDKKSGADPSREAFREMMHHAQLKVFQAIIVWKLDRFSREPMYVVMGYIQRLKKHKVGLISMTEGWLDTREENPVSELILSIMAWFSAEERRKISERTKLGIMKKKEDGTYFGGKRGKDKKPRRIRTDRGLKRGATKNLDLFINKQEITQ